MNKLRPLLLALSLLSPAWAGAAEFDGTRLSPAFAIPFAGILLSIALLPLLTPWFWHHHYGKVAAGWALAFLLPFAALFGLGTAGSELVHVMVGEYIPFVILLTALGDPERPLQWVSKSMDKLADTFAAYALAQARAGADVVALHARRRHQRGRPARLPPRGLAGRSQLLPQAPAPRRPGVGPGRSRADPRRRDVELGA